MAQNQRSLVCWVGPAHRVAEAIGTGLIAATVGVRRGSSSRRPLVEMNALFPSLDAIVLITDMITAVLLFAQFSLSGARPLLALATGYLFTALIVVPHALTFAGAFSPGGLLGAGVQTGSWLFIFWHLGFALGLLAYAALRISKPTEPMPKTSVSAAIWSAAAGSLALVGALTWLATAGQSLLPTLILDNGRLGPNVPYIILCLIAVCGAVVALLLLIRQRSELDHWLIVVAAVSIGELAFSGLLPAVRFSAGFYAGRVFSLITSSIVLIVLLAETTRLYAQVVRSNATLQRERDNKLMNMEAMTASIAHEVSQPLTAISSSGAAALNWLKRKPPDLEETRECVDSMIEAGGRAEKIISSIRGLYGKAIDQRAMIDVADIVREVLNLLQHDLQVNQISVATEFQQNLPEINANGTQIHGVILNLIKNAVDAMDSVLPSKRLLQLAAKLDKSNSVVLLSIEDSGPGIVAQDRDRIFDPFFTTKITGTGLGLSLCRAMVEGHGGHLRLIKTDSSGSIFEIALPIGSTSESSWART
jgi:signal transduction histidine kinase